jgi:drug/metabolite transporter (DMT)-like permease
VPVTHSQALPASAAAIMLALCLAWGLNMVAMKLGTAGISPALQGAMRSAGAALLCWLWCRLRGVPLAPLLGPSLLPGLAVGVIFGLEFGAIFIGAGMTSASRAVLFLYAAPFFVAIGAHLFVPGDSMTPRAASGLLVAFAGLAMGLLDGLQAEGSVVGDLLCLIGALGWASTTVVIKATRLRHAPAEYAMLYQLAVSVPVLLALSLWLGEPGIFAPTPLIWASMAYQTVVVAFASYVAWFWLVKRYAASRLSAFSFLTPLFGALAGWAFLGDQLGPLFILALAMVSAGILLVNSAKR